MPFAIGQRWLSESENALGLGSVTAFDRRTVSLYFAATAQTRRYALAQAPLIRVVLHKGENFPHRANWTGKILTVREQGGLYYYGVQTADGVAEFAETDLSPLLSLHSAQDRLFSAQLDRSSAFSLRYRAWCHQQAQFQSPLRGLRSVRAELIPHQLHIAVEVGRRTAPRVLLADEVGLGKTLEAGMILQQQLVGEQIQRALILVPDSLQHQWWVEMHRRFNLHFSLFDEARCAAAADGENPFETAPFVICALNWLIAQPQRAAQALAAHFDLLIVDEAQHLAWSADNPSPAYLLVEQFAAHIPSVLLLTATPNQLGQAAHFARLRLLDPDRFYDYAAYQQEQRQYRPIAEAVNALLKDDDLVVALTPAQQQRICQLLTPSVVDPLFVQWEQGGEARRTARDCLVRQLIDRHGTGRLFFRNRRQSLSGFPRRRYHPIVLEHDGQRQIWLADFLARHHREKILVICRHAETVWDIARFLREKHGIHAALFHENQTLVERDRAAAYFADEQGSPVLISAMIGAEGRNFQFAHRLVLWDLPSNPDLLEQCIGRLDRIGQRQDVQIYLPLVRYSYEDWLARWYHQGLNAFEQSSSTAMLVFERFLPQLEKTLENLTALSADPTPFERLIADTQAADRDLKSQLELGRDRLLEYHSRGGDAAVALAAAVAAEDARPELMAFATDLFDLIGVDQDDIGEKSWVLTLTGTMAFPDFPGLKEEGISVTFDRHTALAREDMAFLTWDHPMITQGMDLILSGNLGKAAAALLPAPNLPPGTLWLELVYVVEPHAPKGLHLHRFLPPTPLRLLLDAKGNNLAEQQPFAPLQARLKPLGRQMATQMIQRIRPLLTTLFKLGEQRIDKAAQAVIAQAVAQAADQLEQEYQRLVALQRLNPTVRQTEIEQAKRLKTDVEQHLRQATWRLDAARLIVSNNKE